MMVDLLSTLTEDGVKLHGALHRAAPREEPAASVVDVLLCLPGVGGNFYGTSMAEHLTPSLTAAGIDVLWVNTRGHDSIAVVHTRRGGVRQGAAFETVDDCRQDVTAWVDLLVQRGYRAPGLFGHSLGAIKVLYSQAHAPHPLVRAIVAVSPPRLSCRAFLAGPDRERFEADLAVAQQHVDAGRSSELIQTRFPVPLIISAGTYLDKYGPAERYNLQRFVARIECPHLFVYGGRELEQGGIAFAGVPDLLRGLPDRQFSAPVRTVPEADHMYSQKWEPLGRSVLAWLGDPQPAS